MAGSTGNALDPYRVEARNQAWNSSLEQADAQILGFIDGTAIGL